MAQHKDYLPVRSLILPEWEHMVVRRFAGHRE